MKTPHELKQKVMRGVYRAYMVRQLSHPVLRIGAVMAMLFAIRELTFVSKVIENASLKENVLEFAAYFVSAFAGTELIVQLLSIAVLGVVMYTVKDTALNLRFGRLAV